MDYQVELEKLNRLKLFRTRTLNNGNDGVETIFGDQTVINFSANDYLGLSQHPKVIEATVSALRRYGVGSGASHLVTGHHQLHEALECQLAAFLQRPKALYFSTGYMANLGLLQALAGPKDTVIVDKLAHASIIDGTKLSAAKMLRYRHNDMGHLASQLERCSQDSEQVFVATESIFSMDGDSPDLLALNSLAARFGAQVMIDEAHAIGTTKSGRGMVAEANIDCASVPFVVGTLGKALGVFGAFVAGEEDAVEYLVQRSRSYIYTTATPPALAAATSASLNVLQKEPWHLSKLQKNIQYFRRSAMQAELDMLPSNSAIQPLSVGDAEAALILERDLLAKGLLVKAIRYPTVPKNQARLRITLNAHHSHAQIDQLISTLKELSHARF